jgi:hypothetical protein
LSHMTRALFNKAALDSQQPHEAAVCMLVHRAMKVVLNEAGIAYLADA